MSEQGSAAHDAGLDEVGSEDDVVVDAGSEAPPHTMLEDVPTDEWATLERDDVAWTDG